MSSIVATTYGIEVRGQGIPQDPAAMAAALRLPGNSLRHTRAQAHT